MSEEKLKLYRKARLIHGNVLEVLYNYYDKNSEYFIDQSRMFFAGRSKKNVTALKLDSIKLEGNSYNDFIALFIYPSEVLSKSVAEIAKDKRLIKNSDNLEMLNSILNHFFGIFIPLEYDYQNKTILLYDLLTEEKVTIIDEKLVNSIDKVKDTRFMIITKILKYKDINFLTNSIILDFNSECNEFVKKVKQNNLTIFDIYYFGLQYRTKYQ